ncbi:sialic acid-binding Ig-like lectin 12 [Phyllostomus discolor]|uniref:Sialic acid-binding Ig-like lectin 12 n=1 Tax=Phyllostomus discolor TaxID=89673 RepID=A0A7E6CPE4_9CHIR|nr:sialic acid-binding Ig-like lectin 12 [Phyllostomus discolor]
MLLLLLLLLALLWAGSLAEDQGFRLQVQGSVMVQEGQCISVPCTVMYPKIGWTESAPAHGYWFQEGAEPNSDAPVATNNPNRKVRDKNRARFHLVGDPRTYNCSLHIRDAQKKDTGRYFFRVERGSYVKESYINNILSVHVTEKKWGQGEDTWLSPEGSWAGKEPDSPHPGVDSGRLMGTGSYLVPDIHIQGTLESGHPKNITCTVSWACDRETPPIFSWMGTNLTPLGPETPNSSVLTLTPGPQHHGTNLTCRVALPGGQIKEKTVQLNVTYPPQLQGPSCSWEDEGLHCSCSSRAQPAPSLHWWLGEGLLEGNHSNTSHTVTFHSAETWANSSLSIYGELTSNLRLACEAQNTHGKETVTVLLLPGRPGQRTEVIQGVVGGAGATALLAVCLGLIILRICRKKQAEKAESQEGIYQGHLNASSSHHLPPAQAASPSEHELHYAALSFHNMKPHNPQAQETLYSEVKIRK